MANIDKACISVEMLNLGSIVGRLFESEQLPEEIVCSNLKLANVIIHPGSRQSLDS